MRGCSENWTIRYIYGRIDTHHPERYQIVCITNDVERIVRESGIVDGLVLVNPMHITASCYVNDLEYGLHHDIMAGLRNWLLITVRMVKMVKNTVTIELGKTMETLI